VIHDHYQYAVEIERLDRTPLGQFPIVMDWEPAREWACFMTLREADNSTRPNADATVEPEWDRSQGEPFVGGVRVRFNGSENSPRPVSLPLSYFRKAATGASQKLVEKKLLQDGEQFHYSVVAFHASTISNRKLGLDLEVQELPSPVSVRLTPSRGMFDRATAFGTAHEADVPVFIPQMVLDHAANLTREAARAETGGVLIGHVSRDTANRQIYLAITDLIPAKHTRANATQVTFTPDTWSAVDAAIHLRHDDEVMLGWFHSHPAKFWCSPKCPPEARRECPLGRTFFSGEDCMLHRAVFPMAYCVALLVTNTTPGFAMPSSDGGMAWLSSADSMS